MFTSASNRRKNIPCVALLTLLTGPCAIKTSTHSEQGCGDVGCARIYAKMYTHLHRVPKLKMVQRITSVYNGPDTDKTRESNHRIISVCCKLHTGSERMSTDRADGVGGAVVVTAYNTMITAPNTVFGGGWSGDPPPHFSCRSIDFYNWIWLSYRRRLRGGGGLKHSPTPCFRPIWLTNEPFTEYGQFWTILFVPRPMVYSLPSDKCRIREVLNVF